jgi:hypothetical protein
LFEHLPNLSRVEHAVLRRRRVGFVRRRGEPPVEVFAESDNEL